MPVPGGRLEAEMLLRRELARHQPQQADGQEDRADQDVEAVEARRHEEDRTVQARVRGRVVEEQVLMQDVVVFIGLNRGEQDAQRHGDTKNGLTQPILERRALCSLVTKLVLLV